MWISVFEVAWLDLDEGVLMSGEVGLKIGDA